jgi:hypothetical protein
MRRHSRLRRRSGNNFKTDFNGHSLKQNGADFDPTVSLYVSCFQISDYNAKKLVNYSLSHLTSKLVRLSITSKLKMFPYIL